MKVLCSQGYNEDEGPYCVTVNHRLQKNITVNVTKLQNAEEVKRLAQMLAGYQLR